MSQTRNLNFATGNRGGNDDGLTGERTRDAINELDCIICYRWFPTFDRLARHMAARHGRPTPNRPGDVELPPKQPQGARKRIMAKKPARRTAPAQRRGGIPAPAQSDRTSEYNPFIKAADIGGIDDTAVLTLTGKVRVGDSGFGEQMICEVKYNRETYDWGFKVNGANHRILFKRFGSNESKWRGAVNVTIKEFNGNPYIAADRE